MFLRAALIFSAPSILKIEEVLTKKVNTGFMQHLSQYTFMLVLKEGTGQDENIKSALFQTRVTETRVFSERRVFFILSFSTPQYKTTAHFCATISL